MENQKKSNLYYESHVGHGDSSPYRMICKRQVYGPTKAMRKVEQLRHANKIVRTILRSVVRDW